MKKERKVHLDRKKSEVSRVAWAHLRLPPFPQVALRVMQLANSDLVQLHELSELISSDPAFAAEVLSIANSLLYSPRFPSNSILQAIAVLGINNLQGLCLTVGARTYLGRSLNQPAMRAIWRHDLACGLIAELLASAGFMDKDTAYTCGVLHDIGRLALAAVRCEEYSVLLSSHSGSPDSICRAEEELFGMDHCAVGKQLIVEWQMPPDFEAVVARHHEPRVKGGSWGMSELINVSCRMADTIGFTAFPGCEITPWADLLEELPPRERRLFYPDIESLEREVAMRINAVENA
jgi:putative nucleotidyltransferase with HDIG domain